MTYFQIANSRAGFIILPKQHLECLSESIYTFKIIDYDNQYDIAYNYYAEIGLDLSNRINILNDSLNGAVERLDPKKYGFASKADLFKYLTYFGLVPNSELVEFKVKVSGWLKWPESSTNLEFFPGLNKVSPSNINFQDSSIAFFSTDQFATDSTFQNHKNFTYVNSLKGIEFGVNPNLAVGLLQPRLTALLKDKKNVLVHQENLYDPKANAIVLFVNASHKDLNISVLNDQAVDIYSKTPTTYPGLKVVNSNELADLKDQAVFIDTRSRIRGLYIRAAYNAPVYLPSRRNDVLGSSSDLSKSAQLKMAAHLAQSDIVSKKYPTDAIRKLAQNKKIILYGVNPKRFRHLITKRLCHIDTFRSI